MKIFAKRLRQLQKDRGMKQAEFADFLDIAPGTLANYLNDRKNPQIDTVASIADKLGVTVGWLCGDDTEPRRPETYAEVVKTIDWLSSLGTERAPWGGFSVERVMDRSSTSYPAVILQFNSRKLFEYYTKIDQLRGMPGIDKQLQNAVIKALQAEIIGDEPIEQGD